MRCDYAHDDGAYVLGALSPAERSAYERHLSECPECREAVADIAVLPGLLGRLDTATALQLLAEEPAQPAATDPHPWRVAEPDAHPWRSGEPGTRPWPAGGGKDDENRVASLVDAATTVRRREGRTRRFRYATAALAAACLAVLAMLGVGVLNSDFTGNDPGVRMEAMTPVDGELPVTAEIGLENRAWGTEVTMNCAYEKTERYHKAWRLRLVAYGPDNEAEQISSWVAMPGEPVTIKGATSFGGDQLVRLALTRTDGTQLLTYDVP